MLSPRGPVHIVISPFQPENQAEVKQLVLAGLAEHWGEIDPDKNPDLNDIGSTYANATFLVAWLDDHIVGTGALVPRSAEVAEIVRMSVRADVRRNGIGGLILRQLFERARVDGYCRVVLETTATWHRVIEFYRRSGFHITHERDGDVYFVAQLKELITSAR